MLFRAACLALLVALAAPAFAQNQAPSAAGELPLSPVDAKLARLRGKLETVSRDASPEEWGKLQFEIGDALIATGERDRSPARLLPAARRCARR